MGGVLVGGKGQCKDASAPLTTSLPPPAPLYPLSPLPPPRYTHRRPQPPTPSGTDLDARPPPPRYLYETREKVMEPESTQRLHVTP